MQQQITDLALLETERLSETKFVVVSGEGWHRGVIGLAASRIAERVFRPTIVLSCENGMAHGSARGIPNFHLLQAMESCSELFEQFGGHAAAAGMKLKIDNIERLREMLDLHASNILSEEQLVPELNIDAHVSSQTLSLAMVEELKRLEPFGAGNPKPVFVTKDLYIDEEPFVMKEKHLKLKLTASTGKRFEAVWWDGVERSRGRTLRRGNSIELAYTPEANVWKGSTRLQLVVEDLKEHN
jgi:single-stranded-DNA-specific exonuclease